MKKRGTLQLIFKSIMWSILTILFVGSVHLVARIIWVVAPDYIPAVGTVTRRRPELYNTDLIGHVTAHGIALAGALIIVFIILVVALVVLKIKEQQPATFRSSWKSHPSTAEIRVIKVQATTRRDD